MKLSNCSTVELLPEFMRDDPAVSALAAAFDSEIHRFDYYSRHQSVWNQLDNLSEQELDALAEELNLPWYLFDAPIETKRRVIHDGDKVYSHLGTVYAVNEVISAYFGDGTVQEWFDYGGQPFHFRIVSNNPLISNEYLQRFLWLLEQVKRRSAQLDNIILRMREEMRLESGITTHQGNYEHHIFIDDINALNDKLLALRIRVRLDKKVFTHEGTTETHRLMGE